MHEGFRAGLLIALECDMWSKGSLRIKGISWVYTYGAGSYVLPDQQQGTRSLCIVLSELRIEKRTILHL